MMLNVVRQFSSQKGLLLIYALLDLSANPTLYLSSYQGLPSLLPSTIGRNRVVCG